MSIATDARTYADLAVAQGRTALTQASQLLVAANRRLVTDAPKPAYAALGAADLVAAAVTKRVEDLPVDAVNGVSKAQHTSQTVIARAQAEANAKLAELRSRVEDGIETVTALPTTAKTTGETYLSAAVAAGQAYVGTAKNVYGSLTDRGAAKAAQLQHDPRVAKLFGQLSEAGDSVVPAATSAFDDVTTPVKPARKTAASRTAPAKTAASSTAPRKAVARRAAATKTAGTKAPAKKAASARKTTAASARKTTAKKAPAKKA